MANTVGFDQNIPERRNDPDAATALPSVPLKENPSLYENLRKYTKEVFNDFYNTFRFIGYVAQANYSGTMRAISEFLKLPEDTFKPGPIKPDWGSKSRMIVNALEMIVFEAAALWAVIRDKRRLRRPLSLVVAAELGKDPDEITLKDIFASENPIIQTAMNQRKALYVLRFTQPFTFLYSLNVGLTLMGLEIVSERTAYISKNSYEQLQKLAEEIKNNQLGKWSRDTVVARFVDLIQLNRSDHKTPPIQIHDLQKYFPMLGEMADLMIEKKWRQSEMVYVLGQIIRDPADFQKAQETYNDVCSYGLLGIAARKHSGKSNVSAGQEKDTLSADADMQKKPAPKPAFKDIIARGQKSALHEPVNSELVLGRL